MLAATQSTADFPVIDLHAAGTVWDTPCVPVPASANRPPDPALLDFYQSLRKAVPADNLLPRTLQWVTILPPKVRPLALLRQFPRIANAIAATWSDSAAFISYLDSLLNDSRPNRRGFPGAILAELFEINRYYATVMSKERMLWNCVGYSRTERD